MPLSSISRFVTVVEMWMIYMRSKRLPVQDGGISPARYHRPHFFVILNY